MIAFSGVFRSFSVAKPSVVPAIQPKKGMPMKGRILYAEDNDDTRILLTRLLRTEGYHVLTAHSFASAVEVATKERVDLVIADLGLPDRSGLALLAEVRKAHAAKGIVLSGYDIGNDTFDAGYSAHMLKPIDFNRLSALISQVLNK